MAFYQGRKAFPIPYLTPSPSPAFTTPLYSTVILQKPSRQLPHIIRRARHNPQLSSSRHKLHSLPAHSPAERAERERSPGPTAGAEDARVNDSLQRPQQPPEGSSRPPAKLFNWHADGQSSAPILQRQPKRSLLFCLSPLRRSRRQTTIMRCQLYLQRQINAIPLFWFNSCCQGNK